MKAFNFTLAGIFALLIVLTASCHKSAEQLIVGSWQGSDLQIRTDSVRGDTSIWAANREAHRGTMYIFHPDHNFEVMMYFRGQQNASHGQWKLDDKGKTLFITDTVTGLSQQHQIDRLTDSALTLRSTFGFGEVVVSFKKK